MTVKVKMAYEDGNISEVEGDFILCVAVKEPEYSEKNGEVAFDNEDMYTAVLAHGKLSKIGIGIVVTSALSRLSEDSGMTVKEILDIFEYVNTTQMLLEED